MTAARWERVRPAVRSKAQALLPFLPVPKMEPMEELDPVWSLLQDVQSLGVDHQDTTARNLALLWDHFEVAFGGLSGSLVTPETEQLLSLERLKAAGSTFAGCDHGALNPWYGGLMGRIKRGAQDPDSESRSHPM
ncbi:hypothetical protein ILT44_11755 [Microvirga sp. BT689]|uniref:hypothetical protein n=1 Tax=Microvirga arvi TaxID=2778731 RepID=UPI00194DB5E3|nr:hypothetical protein [Microvirga arvi]MBM6580860.1 hypothetical protein [Microvirga arvi]